MIVDPWALAVIIEIALLSAGAATSLWLRARPAPAPIEETPPAEADEAPAEEPAPAEAPPVEDDADRQSFWALHGKPGEAHPGEIPPRAPPSAHAPEEEAAPPVEAAPPRVVTVEKPVLVLLDPADVEAALSTIQGGFGPDDLMQLQDVVGSTESKLTREARGTQQLFEKVRAEAEALSAVLTPLLALVEMGEPVPDELVKAAPVLLKAKALLNDAAPELEDLQGTLAAMANGLSSYKTQEWVPRAVNAEALNARIQARFDAQGGAG